MGIGWGAQNDRQSIAAILAGLDRGLNWIDTAAAYGLGHSASIVGAAVRDLKDDPDSRWISNCLLTNAGARHRRRPIQ
jgi:aryl-alcohol dehydrogenase-like predicted oxidoreductase